MQVPAHALQPAWISLATATRKSDRHNDAVTECVSLRAPGMQPQDAMARLAEARGAVEAARDKGIATPAVVRDRLEASECGFLDLASALLRAPDPLPLLRDHESLLRSDVGADFASWRSYCCFADQGLPAR